MITPSTVTFCVNCFKDEFETVEAENGKEALQLLNEHSRKFSSILLDLIMPVMDVEHKL